MNNMTTTSNSGRFEIINGKCVIPQGVTEIADQEFCKVHELREVVIPDSVIRIGEFAFDCTGLSEVKIPCGVKVVADGAFSDCFGLTRVEFPDTLVSIGEYGFSDCPFRSVELPGSLVCIGRAAFAETDLVGIQIPASVISIGRGAFSGCSRLESILVDEKNPMYRSVSDACLTRDGETLVFGCMNSVIPDGVLFIAPNAFESCTGLGYVEFPNSIRIIQDAAFSCCRNLKAVKLPKSLTTIGREAFSNCENLARPDIPTSVITIGDKAFFIPEGDCGDELPF
jgi:hypothetical protein